MKDHWVEYVSYTLCIFMYIYLLCIRGAFLVVMGKLAVSAFWVVEANRGCEWFIARKIANNFQLMALTVR